MGPFPQWEGTFRRSDSRGCRGDTDTEGFSARGGGEMEISWGRTTFVDVES